MMAPESDKPPISATIPHELAGKRLDQALAVVFPDYSRSRLTQWLRDGLVTVDAKRVKPRQAVAGGEHVALSPPAVADERWNAEALPLELLFEDEDLLVVNKPAGLIVHPGAGNYDGTLVNALLHHRPELAALPRAGIVHRLDKDTSGLLLVARSDRAHKFLVEALSRRTVSRQYDAIVNGVPTGGATVNEPIGRHRVQRPRMTTSPHGRSGAREAVTHYRVLKRYRAHAHLEVKLDTGRTHQIRVHMEHAGFPLAGDPIYGRKRMAKGVGADLRAALLTFPRQALHARRLALEHPAHGQPLQFESPLPDDMLALLAVLAQDAASERRQK
ncbi:MAG: 23S rRNA pseudouridine(1911/1915/1917) synthase RluD [Gammaproteobacteria bacterium]